MSITCLILHCLWNTSVCRDSESWCDFHASPRFPFACWLAHFSYLLVISWRWSNCSLSSLALLENRLVVSVLPQWSSSDLAVPFALQAGTMSWIVTLYYYDSVSRISLALLTPSCSAPELLDCYVIELGLYFEVCFCRSALTSSLKCISYIYQPSRRSITKIKDHNHQVFRDRFCHSSFHRLFFETFWPILQFFCI